MDYFLEYWIFKLSTFISDSFTILYLCSQMADTLNYLPINWKENKKYVFEIIPSIDIIYFYEKKCWAHCIFLKLKCDYQKQKILENKNLSF